MAAMKAIATRQPSRLDGVWVGVAAWKDTPGRLT